jgi:hypothetical protein
MNKQQGSAHVIVVGVLVVALLGALGFIFWQNFLQDDQDEDQAKTTVAKTDDRNAPVATENVNIYENDSYSFNYPVENWNVSEVEAQTDAMLKVTPQVKTNDYEPNMGMGIKTGAIVAVYANVAQTSISQEKANMSELTGIENIEDVTVGGINGYSYRSSYEGERLCTVVIKSGIMYQIQYQYAGTDQSVHRDAYDTIVESFKFK